MNAETKSDYLYLREDVHQPLRKPGMSLSDCRKQTISWYKCLDPEQTILHTRLTGQIFGLLGVTSYHQIQSIIENPELRQTASNRLMRQLTKLYGIKDPETMREKCEAYGSDANAVRDHLQWVLSYQGSTSLEMVNEIRAYNDPTDLLLLSLNGKWSEKARWDAKVKLQFMGLAASIYKREGDLKLEDQFKDFVDWMNEEVRDPDLQFGESKGAYLISTHDPETWACTSTRWISEEEGSKLQPQPFQKKTHMLRRNFKTNMRNSIDAYVSIRDKSRPMKIVKMLRKKAEDPAIAVDDDTGLLVVVNNHRAAIKFISHLIDRGYQSERSIIIEDVSNTLDGGEYNGNLGSSPKLRMMKFFVRLANNANKMRVECIIHTPETYAESLYMRGVSHLEFEVNRLVDTGVPNTVFRKKYFPYFDTDEARKQAIARIRATIEGAWRHE